MFFSDLNPRVKTDPSPVFFWGGLLFWPVWRQERCCHGTYGAVPLCRPGDEVRCGCFATQPQEILPVFWFAVGQGAKPSRISTAGCLQSAVVHLHNLSTSNLTWKDQKGTSRCSHGSKQSNDQGSLAFHSKRSKRGGIRMTEPTIVACFILRLEEQLTSTWNLQKDQHFMRYYNCGTFARTIWYGKTEIFLDWMRADMSIYMSIHFIGKPFWRF